MDITPYADHEQISTLLRALRSGDKEWIHDAAERARQEPRLERVVDSLLARKSTPGEPVPMEVKAVPYRDPDDDSGTKGGEAHPELVEQSPTATADEQGTGRHKR